MSTDIQRRQAAGRHAADLSDPGAAILAEPSSKAKHTAAWLAGQPSTWRSRHPEWPIAALLALYPLWWALGLADWMLIILAVPLALRLRRWSGTRSRTVQLPDGFAIWLVFLLVMLAGAAMLTLRAPDTVAGSLFNRALSFTNRAANYGAVTVLLLVACNLTERELSRRRLAWLLGLVAIYATVGGLAGMALPHFQFTSPLAYVMPHSLQHSSLMGSALHPGLSQVQSVLGTAQGRPKAPFDYTNSWGYGLTILLPWLLVAWWAEGTRRQRRLAMLIAVVAIVPIVYSLDRGVWIGVAVSAVYLALRMAAKGRLALLGATCAAIAVVGIAVVATPLGNVITQRLQHGESNSVRTSLSGTAVKASLASPILGYGDTRHLQGSPNSSAIGPTANCQQCGQYPVGSNGQLWLLLVCNGVVGAVLYLGFFAYGLRRFWRDTTPYGLAGGLVLVLTFVYMFTYTAQPVLLGITMLSYALLWRNDRHHPRLRQQAQIQPGGSR
jgi:hypothetical protein